MRRPRAPCPGAVAEIPLPLLAVGGEPFGRERRFPRAAAELERLEVGVGEAIGGRMMRHAHGVGERLERSRVDLADEDLVIGAEVVVLVARGGKGEERTVARQHREVEIAELRRQPAIALVQNRADPPARELDPVDRSADARRPEAPAAVVREVGLAAALGPAQGDAPAVAVEGRELDPAVGRPRQPAVDQPAVLRQLLDGEELGRAAVEVGEDRPPAVVDEDHLARASPDRGTMLEVGACGGGELALGGAVGPDEPQRPGDVARRIDLLAFRERQVGDPGAARRHMGTAVTPPRLVRSELPRRAAA